MLQIDPPSPTFMTVTDALVGAGGYWQNTDFYNTQFKVLRSKGLGEKVVERLKLTDREPFKSSPDPATLFMGHVRVAPIPESRLVTVTVTHRDPKDAALWANTLADVYIEQSLEMRVEAARQAYDWLQERLGATQEEMQEAQDRLFRSYQTQDLFVPEGSVSAVSTSIAKLNEDYVQAQARRIEIEAALKQAGEMKESGRGPRRPAPGRLRRGGVRLQRPAGRPRRGAGPPRGEVQGGPPRDAEGAGPDRPAPQGEGGPGRADPRGPRGRVHPAPEARRRAAGRPSTPRRPRPPTRAAR